MNAVIYTAVFGAIKDDLFPPKNQPEGVRCIAFVDDPSVKVEGWELRPPAWPRPNKRKMARHHKMLPHDLFPEVDYSLWVDGCLTPRQNIDDLIETFLNDADICLFEHMERSCVYQEAEACVTLKKDDPGIIRRVTEEYKKEGYPYHNGLAETTACLRRHTDAICDLNVAWWTEIQNNSVRDQLSIDYLCWKRGIEYATFDGGRTQSPHFEWRPHR